MADGVTRGSVLMHKIRTQRQQSAPVHCCTEDRRNLFPESQAQSLEHDRSTPFSPLYKSLYLNLGFLHKHVKNDTFSKEI
jgi:hypothetical protein